MIITVKKEPVMIYTILNESTGVITENYYRDLNLCEDDCFDLAMENPGVNFAITDETGKTMAVYCSNGWQQGG